MNRRHFIGRSFATVGVAAAARNSGFANTVNPRRIPIGFLGASYSHGADKIRLTSRSPDWEFVGVCDETEAGRQVCERLGAKRISQEELFRRAEVVAVESEIRDHARHALMALEAGKHVHVEKPPATRRAEIQAIVDLARRRERLVQAGYMWRYHPGFQAVTEAVRRGWLGEVVQVRAYMGNHLARDRRPEWAEFAGGSMFEQGSHLVDAVVRLLGRPKTISTFLRRHGGFEDALVDNNLAVLEFERATAMISNTALQAASTPHRSFEVIGTRGTALLLPIEPPTLVLDLSEAAGPYRKGPQTAPMPRYERYIGDFDELARAVRGETRLLASLDEELLVAETVLRASGME